MKSWSTTFYHTTNCSPYCFCAAADFCSDYHSAVLICSPGPVAWWSQCSTIILLRMTWILVWALCEQWRGREHSVNILPHKCVMDLIGTNMGLFKPPLEHWHAFWVVFFSPHVINSLLCAGTVLWCCTACNFNLQVVFSIFYLQYRNTELESKDTQKYHTKAQSQTVIFEYNG